MSKTGIILNDGLTLFNEVVGNVTSTLDPASISTGAAATNTVTVTGAAIGDYVLVSPGVDLGGLIMSATVTNADTVTIVLGNMTGSSVDLASADWEVKVLR